MTWALLEILLPLTLAVAVGVFMGWLVWRWRRRNVTAHEWNRLNAGTESALAELASVRAAHTEAVNERTALAATVASTNADMESTRNELEVEKRRNRELSGEIEGADARIASLSAELSEATTRVTALESGLASAQRTITGMNSDEATSTDELEAVRLELDASQGRIADLEARLAASESQTREAAPADTGEIGRLRVELAERDRRIRALEQAARSDEG